MLRDYADVPEMRRLFGRMPSMSRLRLIARLLTAEVWLRQAAAGKALTWEEMLAATAPSHPSSHR